MYQKSTQNAQIMRLSYGRTPLKYSFSLLQFEKKGLSQQLLHNLKYKGQEQIGSFMGNWLGKQILEKFNTLPFDAIVIVPVSKRTLKKRGYNQVAKFGHKLSKTLQVPVAKNLLLKENGRTSSVFLSKLARAAKPAHFYLNPKAVRTDYKHILLVDDLITTGATLEACAKELLKIPDVSLSFASIAVV
ncbi:MAG: ComF family protein [Gilvibacter sp.]